LKFIKPIIILCLAVVLSFFTLGLINPSVTVEDKIEVNAMISEAFASVIEPTTINKWFPQITNIKHFEGLPYTKGSVEKCILQLEDEQIEIEAQIEEINPYKSSIVSFQNHKFKGSVEMFFNQTGKNTLVTYKISIEGNNIFYRALFALSKSIIESESVLAFARYKEVVESLPYL